LVVLLEGCIAWYGASGRTSSNGICCCMYFFGRRCSVRSSSGTLLLLLHMLLQERLGSQIMTVCCRITNSGICRLLDREIRRTLLLSPQIACLMRRVAVPYDTLLSGSRGRGSLFWLCVRSVQVMVVVVVRNSCSGRVCRRRI
jgi:hypothetical protein